MFDCSRNCEDRIKFNNKLYNINNNEAMKDKIGSSLSLKMNHVVRSQECAHDDLALGSRAEVKRLLVDLKINLCIWRLKYFYEFIFFAFELGSKSFMVCKQILK